MVTVFQTLDNLLTDLIQRKIRVIFLGREEYLFSKNFQVIKELHPHFLVFFVLFKQLISEH